jgi:hypothetical protein
MDDIKPVGVAKRVGALALGIVALLAPVSAPFILFFLGPVIVTAEPSTRIFISLIVFAVAGSMAKEFWPWGMAAIKASFYGRHLAKQLQIDENASMKLP